MPAFPRLTYNRIIAPVLSLDRDAASPDPYRCCHLARHSDVSAGPARMVAMWKIEVSIDQFPPIKPHHHHHCPNTLPPPCTVRREIDAGLRVSLLGSRWPGVATSLLLLIVVGGSLSHLTTSLGTNVTYLTLFSPCTLRSALVLVITLLLNLTSLSPLTNHSPPRHCTVSTTISAQLPISSTFIELNTAPAVRHGHTVH